jgi:hypothetical protein
LRASRISLSSITMLVRMVCSPPRFSTHPKVVPWSSQPGERLTLSGSPANAGNVPARLCLPPEVRWVRRSRG